MIPQFCSVFVKLNINTKKSAKCGTSTSFFFLQPAIASNIRPLLFLSFSPCSSHRTRYNDNFIQPIFVTAASPSLASHLLPPLKTRHSPYLHCHGPANIILWPSSPTETPLPLSNPRPPHQQQKIATSFPLPSASPNESQQQ